jgi:hypothetical protein
MAFVNPIAIGRVLLQVRFFFFFCKLHLLGRNTLMEALTVAAASQVGPSVLLAWFAHFFALLGYTAAHALLAPVAGAVRAEASKGTGQAQGTGRTGPSSAAGRARSGWGLRRFFDMLEYGSSSDYVSAEYQVFWFSGFWSTALKPSLCTFQ